MAINAVLLIGLLAQVAHGHVRWQRADVSWQAVVETKVICGEQRAFICFANGTNQVTVSVLIESHTYQRNSYPLYTRAAIGEVQLNLTNVSVSSQHTELSDFNISASDNHSHDIIITCTDVFNTAQLHIHRQSEMNPVALCNVTYLSQGYLLQWSESPHNGWKSDVLMHYTVILKTWNGSTIIYYQRETFIVVIEPSAMTVTVNVTNICGETTTLAAADFAVHRSGTVAPTILTDTDETTFSTHVSDNSSDPSADLTLICVLLIVIIMQ